GHAVPVKRSAVASHGPDVVPAAPVREHAGRVDPARPGLAGVVPAPDVHSALWLVGAGHPGPARAPPDRAMVADGSHDLRRGLAVPVLHEWAVEEPDVGRAPPP